MLQEHLTRDYSDLEVTEEDWDVLAKSSTLPGVEVLLKVCLSRALEIERSFFDPGRQKPMTETEAWGFHQAYMAYRAIADLILNPTLEEQEDE